jgi:hypothetical protein
VHLSFGSLSPNYRKVLAGASNMSEHTPTQGASKYDRPVDSNSEVTESVKTQENTVPPSDQPLPLTNELCSGYFVQPVCHLISCKHILIIKFRWNCDDRGLSLQLQWMSFLGQGEGAGKIPCPNEKCSAKIGNYDWAGYKCHCGPWVTPVCAVLTLLLEKACIDPIRKGILYSSFQS